jgi:hypothetical protein
MFLSGVITWMNAVLVQGQRVLTSHKELFEFKKPESLLLSHHEFPKEQLIKLEDRCRYEEEFFVYAFHRVIFFLNKVSNIFSGFRQIYDQIENINGYGKIKDIRDMRVHMDEYAKGKGKNQKNFICNFISESEFINWDVDAFTTIIKQDTNFIGGRINVRESIKVIEELLPTVMKLCEKIFDNSQNNDTVSKSV